MALKAQQISRRPAVDATRSQLDSLENRQLMAGYAANISFQFNSDAAPAGYQVDGGQKYAARGGKVFGWNVDNWKNFTKTSTATDVKSAYAKFGAAGQATSWDIAVPNGTYSVNIVAGDATAYTGKYAIKAENTIVVNSAPTSANRFVSATATVIVTDGKLTLSSATGALNNKIDAVTLKQVSTSTAPTAGGASVTPIAPDDIVADATSTSAIALTWSDSSNETSYTIQRSLDGTTFTDIANLGAGTTSFTNTGLAANTVYFYRVKATNAYGSDIGGTISARTDSTASQSAPSAPSDLDAWSKTSTAVGLDWTTVDNETGYIIQQSTDNKSFAEVGRVGVNVNYFAATNLDAGVKYYWRVIAYNAGGNSAASNVATFTIAGSTSSNPTTPATPSTPSTPSTPTNSNDNLNSQALTGIVPNVLGVDKAIPVLKALGMKSVRVWYSINSWTGAVKPDSIAEFQKYKNAGFTVTVAFVAKTVPPSADVAKAMFERLGASGLKNVVDYWEIGNEMNMSQYWNGTLKQYVDLNLKPAYEALHAIGEKVIGGGLSWDFNRAKELQADGYSNYCDYAGFHPYGESGSIVIQRARDARANFGNKPMMITEWNVQFVTDPVKWVKEINIAAAGLANIAVMNYYYSMGVDSSHVGKGGLFYSDGSKNQPFYDAVYSWVH